METAYCGLELGSSKCVLGVRDEKGETVHGAEFETSEKNLIAAFREIPFPKVVHMESTELAPWVRSVLLRRKIPKIERVIISDPKRNAWIAKDTVKNDKVDAFKLAELARVGCFHEVYYAEEKDRYEFKILVRHHERLTREAVRQKHQIKAILRAQGVIVKGESMYSAEGRVRVLNQVRSEIPHKIAKEQFEILDRILEERKEALELMKRESKKFPEIRLFVDVTGIKAILACRFSAYIQTPFRFKTRKRLLRYCRLGITDRTSDGKPLARKRLDRCGVGSLKDVSRKAFNACLRSKEDNLFKRAYRSTLQRTHSETHARLSTQRKILVVLWTLWRKNVPFRDERG